MIRELMEVPRIKKHVEMQLSQARNKKWYPGRSKYLNVPPTEKEIVAQIKSHQPGNR